MFFDRYRLYSLIYEKLYGQPKQHSYLVDPADQYWHGLWILACHFDNFDDLILGKQLLEKSAKASNMLALNYVGYSLCCGAVPFDIDEKHGIEMGFESAKAYEAAAAAVVANPNALHKTEKEDGDDVYYLEETNEFVIVSKDGYLRTYFLPSGGKKYYDKQ